MAEQLWVKIASWHGMKPDDPNATLCGLEIAEEDEVFTALPPEWWKDKSCETCLRILAVDTFGKES